MENTRRKLTGKKQKTIHNYRIHVILVSFCLIITVNFYYTPYIVVPATKNDIKVVLDQEKVGNPCTKEMPQRTV